MKLGLFGGAFDPPHLAHRAVVEAVRDRLGIERIVVLPAGHHPFKGGSHHAPAEARLALCRLAFVDLPWVEVSDHEIRSGGVAYTVDTLRAFRACYGPGVALYFLIGADNLRDLPRWHEHHQALALAQFVVVPRPGFGVDAATLARLDLTEAERAGLLAHVVSLAPSALSASEVRRRLAAGEDVRDALHPAVWRAIEQRKLYRP